MLDKATAFRIKIANKNQLRQLLKQKKEAYSLIEDAHEMEFTRKKLQDEIAAIELELATYD